MGPIRGEGPVGEVGKVEGQMVNSEKRSLSFVSQQMQWLRYDLILHMSFYDVILYLIVSADTCIHNPYFGKSIA